MTCDLWIPYLFANFIILLTQIITYKFFSKNIAGIIISGTFMTAVFAFLIKFLAETMVGCVFG